MPAIVSLLFSLLPVVAASSPQSVGSDLTIITHNDLYGNDTTRNAAAIALSSTSTNSDAASRCAALKTSLWSPDTSKQDLSFLRYLDHSNTSYGGAAYWIGHGDASCRAITTAGHVQNYPCTAQLPALCASTATDGNRHVSVTTGNATVTGIHTTQAFRFLGLKYATIPARFAQSNYLAPAPNTTALEYGPTCVQSGCKSCSEDCLYLNIWTPFLPNGQVASDKKKAVMLWIHGGAFTSGSGSDTTFDGSALASRGDVVLVTINYRLSTLGFLAVENTNATGNYGLRDQNTALDWVHAHIEDFGGDKDRITIFGQSAGSASVRALLASPQARDKVAGAIMQSSPQGTGDRSAYNKYLTIPQTSNQTRLIMNETACSSPGQELVDCLRKIDPKKLVGQKTVANRPVVDGTFLTSNSLPLQAGTSTLDIPILAGVMRDDGSPFISYPTSTNLSAILTAAGYPLDAVLNSSAFPVPYDALTTQSIFNLTSRLSTDAQFRCLGQSTAHVAAKNSIFAKYYAYEFDHAYQIAEWSPNPPACEAPVTHAHPFGDPSAPFYKCHSGELYAVFGTTVSQGRVPRDQNDIPFSQFIVDTWSAFARTGDPTPDAAFLDARGFTNTSLLIAKGGKWNPVGKGNETPVRILDVDVRNEGWREAEQCDALGSGLEYYNDNAA
ncbi:Alpha/Beta hydrolase protein [Phaeosphaeria sp. MPI-PUGE-AT-0046c]|nr:Alpha/Beta hydrolase protein [Phaeosphaeria sp. MPI-PUGE-AT-0046c]